MADSPHRPGADDRTGAGPDRGFAHVPPGAPRWVKVAAIIVGVLLLLVVIVQLTGLGGDHGPGRHTGAAGTPSTGIAEVHGLGGIDPDRDAPARGSYS